MTSDVLLKLQAILVRILNATNAWPGVQYLELGAFAAEFAEDEDSRFSGIPGWNAARDQVDRLERFDFRQLDSEMFSPSPSGWWRTMCDAAHQLTVSSDTTPRMAMADNWMTLMDGLRDVQLAWNQVYERESQIRRERLTGEIAGDRPDRADLESDSAEVAAVDEPETVFDVGMFDAKCLALRASLCEHHCRDGELIDAEALSLNDIIVKLKEWSRSGKKDHGFSKTTVSRMMSRVFDSDGGKGHGMYKYFLEHEPSAFIAKVQGDLWIGPSAGDYSKLEPEDDGSESDES